MKSCEKKWQRCLDKIRDNVGTEKFNYWFTKIRVSDYVETEGEKRLTLFVPSQFYYNLFEGEVQLAGIGTSFCDLLHRTLISEFGNDLRLSYDIPTISDDEGSNVKIEAARHSLNVTNGTAQKVRTAASTPEKPEFAHFDSHLNSIYNFSNYCVGESNKLPFTIAKYIATNPQKTDFNPFFLYGSVGVGKTHLIQAIGTQLKAEMPQARVLYLTMRLFQNLYSMAVIKKQVPRFLNEYQSIDVLLLDDVQELSFCDGTAEILFPVFNYLHQHNKKLIFTSDRSPNELDGIADRLIDRFKWGAVEELPKPDFNLRRSILMLKAKRNGLELSEEIVDRIARNVTGSVRELESVVLSILGRSIALNMPITLELVDSVLSRAIKASRRRDVNFDMIVETTAEFFKLNPDVIFSHSRSRSIADARQIVMYLCKKHTDLSNKGIGRRLNREHSTVLHGVKAVADRMDVEPEIAEAVSKIENILCRE